MVHSNAMNAANSMTDRAARPLVLGAGGRLGAALQEAMEAGFPAAVFATRAELDVTDRWRLAAEIERLEPSVVVNAASFTHVDGCEDEPERAEAVNHEGARHVARAARQAGARLVHVSTDLVFDGKLERPYTEEDAPAPLSVYGRTKLAGEKAALEEHPGACILRASWFFGAGEGKFPENFLARLAARKPLALVDDRYGSPTYIPDLAEAIVRLLGAPHEGILHFTNGGERTTRFHFVERAAAAAGIDAATLGRISWRDWKGDRAPRPVNSALDASRFASVTGWAPRTWGEALGAFAASRALARELP